MYQYQEVYRGIGFHLTEKGFWFFNEVPSGGGHRAWADYLSLQEQIAIDQGTRAGARVMRAAIDRHLTNRRG